MEYRQQVTVVQPATFSVFSADQLHNPLYLGVRKTDKESYFPKTPENVFVVAISASSHQLNDVREPCLCVSLVLLDSDPDPATCPDTINVVGGSESQTCQLTLFCTEYFLEHYDLKDYKPYFIRKISPPPLTKVTLGSSDPEAFTWTRSHVFSTGLLVGVCNQHKVLARKNDQFAIPYSHLFEGDGAYNHRLLIALTVLDAEPFLQGVITLKTEFVVVNRSTVTSTEVSSAPVLPSSKPCAIQVSDFAVPLTSVFVPRVINKPTLSSDKQRNITLQRDWNILPCQYLHHQKGIALESAIDHTVFVNLSTAKKFSLFNDSWIEIKVEPKQQISQNGHKATEVSSSQKNGNTTGGNGQPRFTSRVTNVCVLQSLSTITKGGHSTREDDSDAFFLPISLWYNLHRQPVKPDIDKTLIKFRKHQAQTEFLVSSSATCESILLHAREVYISCVFSPQYSTGVLYNTVLQKYFNTPRSLKQGDVFAVDTRVDIGCVQQKEEIDENNIVYFLVNRIKPRTSNKQQTYRVDTDHSTLIQDSPCHSYVPSIIESLLTGRKNNYHALPGLANHMDSLAELLKPYLEKWRVCAESVPAILLHGPAGCGKTTVCKAVAAATNMHYFKVNCHDMCGETSSATEARILQTFRRACMYSPCVLQLHNIQALGRDRDGNNEDARVASYFHECIEKVLHKESADWPVVVISTTSALKRLTSDMHAGFLHTFEIEVPDERARAAILHCLLELSPCGSSLSLARVSQRTAGFVLGDLNMLISQARKEAYKNVLKLCVPSGTVPSRDDEYSICMCGPQLHQSHFDTALDNMQAAHSDAMGAPKIPNVTWSDVGGLAAVKADILDTIQLPLQHPQLFAAGLRRSGVLLYGPPGTGKTLLAKAVATECSLNFLSVKGPELINMYVGQSEENIREVFSRARNATPCVIFFDELDSLAPNRGRSGDSGGVMDRVVSQLLAELDGLHKSCDVFVIGATNRPDLLDPALLRPGRFDKLLYLGVSDDRQSQLNILRALTRKFKLAPTCDLAVITEKCPLTLTGADLYALCSDAMLNSLKRQIDKLESGAESSEVVEVCEGDFYEALDNLVPSVSNEELQRYKDLQKTLAINK